MEHPHSSKCLDGDWAIYQQNCTTNWCQCGNISHTKGDGDGDGDGYDPNCTICINNHPKIIEDPNYPGYTTILHK